MSRRIFRATALRRYNDSLDKIELPRYASPPWPAVLWALVGLLLALTALLWSAQTPIYATGPGVVVQAPDGFAGEGEIVLAAFLAPEFASRVRVEQPAIVHLDGLAADGPAIGIMQTVAAVEPAVAAPAAVRARYGLDDSTGLLVDGPTIVALIRLDAPAPQLPLLPNEAAGPAETMLGSVGEVQIEVGVQRGLALLPGIGRFFRVDSHASR